MRDKNSTGASNSVANESSNSEKEVRSSGNERRKDSASSVQTTTGMSTNSNVNAAGSSRIALQHGESRGKISNAHIKAKQAYLLVRCRNCAKLKYWWYT